MRVRTLLTLSFGAALGAAAVYLLDPEHGEERRREARRVALAQARSGAGAVLGDARRRAEELAVSAVAGYREARVADDPVGEGGP